MVESICGQGFAYAHKVEEKMLKTNQTRARKYYKRHKRSRLKTIFGHRISSSVSLFIGVCGIKTCKARIHIDLRQTQAGLCASHAWPNAIELIVACLLVAIECPIGPAGPRSFFSFLFFFSLDFLLASLLVCLDGLLNWPISKTNLIWGGPIFS
jgi:hypothetical protein